MSFSDAGNPDAGMIAAGNYAALSGILPYAKKSGITSFSSLGCIKKALHTKKVGHTGTLDSFAEGLLVVLTGSLTRLVPFFTLFDKTYEAVISFGEETDTLDPSGSVIRSAPLPSFADFEKSLASLRGNVMQSPPAYSAIHVNGKRASELAREGKLEYLPERPVTVFKSEILETRLTPENRVSCARVLFHVSKGTYIRSLARDIALSCNSAAHLIGLKRTKVGCFSLDKAAFADELEDFTIEAVVRRIESGTMREPETEGKNGISPCGKRAGILQAQTENIILRSLMAFDRRTAEYCGFVPLTLREDRRTDFINGKPLKAAFFEDFERIAVCKNHLQPNTPCKQHIPSAVQIVHGKEGEIHAAVPLNCAVFLPAGDFCGIVQTMPSSNTVFPRLKYGFVVHAL